ncbi:MULTISPECIES: hypothetical protein [unclassified Pseudoalteromonas]|uniref:hypothetical protein n=1 Tax=unclassified Pseudoalteromonas TaxID=194690 RepID=UPI0005A9C647|nr:MULTISPECIES: hypothetical protein [unclassified Pseudoalteromonas]
MKKLPPKELCSLFAVVGFGAGLLLGLFAYFYSLIKGEGFLYASINLIVPPFAYMVSLLITSAFGYPFYSLFCSRKKKGKKADE